MVREEDRELFSFSKKSTDVNGLWRVRAVSALKKKKKSWMKLREKDFDQDTKNDAASTLVMALGDTAFRVCSAHVEEPLKMKKALKEHYVSSQAESSISVLASVLTKKYQSGQDIAEFIDEFESLFDQLDKMGKELSGPKLYKAPLMLNSHGTNSSLESYLKTLGLHDVDDLKWKSVAADLILEHERNKAAESNQKNERKNSLKKNREATLKKPKKAFAAKPKSDMTCTFCAKKGHNKSKCRINSRSDECKQQKKA